MGVLGSSLVLASLAWPSAVPRQARGQGLDEQIGYSLLEWSEAPQCSGGELTERLAALGPGAELALCRWVHDPVGLGPALEPVTGALVSLGGGSSTLEALASLALSPSRDVRVRGLRALGELGRPESLPVVLAGMDDDVRRVREAAADAALALQQAGAAPTLLVELERRLREMRHVDHAALMLGALGTEESRRLVLRLVARWSDDRVVVAGLSGLSLCAKEEDGPLIQGMLSPSHSLAVRKQACLLLGRLGWSPAARDLLDCMHAQDAGLAANAHWALQAISGLRLGAVPALWEAWWESASRSAPGAR